MTFEIKTPSSGLSYNDRVLIFDGLNHFIRSFAAVPVQNEDGEHVGGLYGFVSSMATIAKRLQPTRIILVFDGKGSTKQRKAIYEDYKSNRAVRDTLNRTKGFENTQDESEAMKRQFKRLYEYLLLLPVDILLFDGTEADDIISYVTTKLDNEVYICSTDKDFYQLITDRIKVYNPVKKEIVDKNIVLERFKTSPQNFVYYKSLMGDGSDNIPGITGVGPKTIEKDLPELQSETRLTPKDFSNLLNEKSTTKTKKILDNLDTLDRNYKLMQLHEPLVNGKMKLEINDVLSQDLANYNRFLLRKLFREDKINPDKIMSKDDIFTQLSIIYRNYKQAK